MERISNRRKLLSGHRRNGAGAATCLRRVYGAIIVKNDEIISTGYNGAPRGRKHCVTWAAPGKPCRFPGDSGTSCAAALHAEANAIISASRRDMVGSTLYLVGRDGQTGALLGDATSAMCRRQVINAGITRVIIRRTETEFKVVDVNDWVHQEDDVPALRLSGPRA